MEKLKENEFFVIIGRGKTGKARTGKCRYIFFDNTCTNADHDRLDSILTQSYKTIKEPMLSRKEFIAKVRKEISGLAEILKSTSTKILDVTLPCGKEIHFHVIPRKKMKIGHGILPGIDDVRTCRVCGCTDDHACEGGCEWIEWDLCSKCKGKG